MGFSIPFFYVFRPTWGIAKGACGSCKSWMECQPYMQCLGQPSSFNKMVFKLFLKRTHREFPDYWKKGIHGWLTTVNGSGRQPFNYTIQFQENGNFVISTLTIKPESEKDISNYSCEASNTLGKEETQFTLSGIKYQRFNKITLNWHIAP